MQQENDWILVKELAKATQVEPSTVRYWIRRRYLTAKRHGLKEFLVLREDARRFIEEKDLKVVSTI